MKEIEIFYLTNCPYCINARKAIAELTEENAAYRELGIRWIEESIETGLAEQRDYYYVPTVFYRARKLYEAKPGQDFSTIKKSLRQAFDTVLAS